MKHWSNVLITSTGQNTEVLSLDIYLNQIDIKYTPIGVGKICRTKAGAGSPNNDYNIKQ